jgi:hypothetical protein
MEVPKQQSGKGLVETQKKKNIQYKYRRTGRQRLTGGQNNKNGRFDHIFQSWSIYNNTISLPL